MLNIDGVEAKYGKYANNTEFEGERFTTGWTLPIEMNLTCEQFEEAFECKHFTRQLFDEKKGEKYSAWKNMHEGPFKMGYEFENAGFEMKFTGGKSIEFENDCRVSKIEYELIDGGRLQVKCHVYVHPTAEHKRPLENFQHSTVHVSFWDAKVAGKTRDKQQNLFDAKNGAAADGGAGDKPAEGDGDKNEKASKAQVAAFNKGRKAKDAPKDAH